MFEHERTAIEYELNIDHECKWNGYVSTDMELSIGILPTRDNSENCYLRLFWGTNSTKQLSTRVQEAINNLLSGISSSRYPTICSMPLIEGVFTLAHKRRDGDRIASIWIIPDQLEQNYRFNLPRVDADITASGFSYKSTFK